MTNQTCCYTFYMIHRKSRNIIDIYDEEDGEHYIGSTVNFRTRCTEHRSRCTNENDIRYDYKIYKHIRKNGGFNDWDITVLETHDNLTKKDARVHERWLIELYKSELNCLLPISTDAEKVAERAAYYQTYKAHYAAHNAAYYQTHKAYYASYYQTHKKTSLPKYII